MGPTEREREALCLSVSWLLIAVMLLFILCCHGCASSRKPPAGAAFGTDKAEDLSAKQAKDNGPGFSGGPGDVPDGGMLNGGGGQAGPLGEPQSLADWSQTAINPWGPVIQTHYVSKGQGGQIVPVNQLFSPDPFTATYQLEDGTIVVSNRPLSEIVASQDLVELPPIVEWHGPNGPVMMFEDEILVNFTPTATQQDIETLISQYNLHVIMSWFEPPNEPGMGNAIASFQFEYDEGLFATFDDADTFFNSHPLVAHAGPNTADQIEDHYDPPNDPIYTGWTEPDQTEYNPLARFVNVLGTDATGLVPAGPEAEDGEWFSDQVVAVVDDGVFRTHPDYAFV
jgi:hypothetical protein